MRKWTRTVSALILSLALLPSTPGMASSAQGPKGGVVVKNRAPVSKEVLKVKFPRPKEIKLKNGLTVLVMEDHRLPTVIYQMFMPRGALTADPALPGLASFTADLLKEGAGSRNSLQIAQTLDNFGASFFATSAFGSNVTSVGISGLSEYASPLLDLFSDLLLRPTFPADELEKYRSREVQALEQKRVNADFLSNERLMSAIYPNHPMSVVAPTVDSLKAVNRDALAKYHSQNYVPDGAILSVTGDVDVKQLTAQLEKAFAGWKMSGGKPAVVPPVKAAEKLNVVLVNRPASVQTNLNMGNVGITRTDPDYVPVMVMTYIFGASSSSRLFMTLREEKGYTYGAYASFSPSELAGPWSATAEVRTDVTEPALAEFVTQINRIRSEPVTVEELENAKRALTARFALSLERSQSLTNRALELKRYGLTPDYWDQYPALVQKVTAEDITRVAKKYLDPTTMQVIAVGDGEKIREGLKKFGTVVEYDLKGNKVSP